MNKKIMMSIILSVLFLFTQQVFVNAYSPHYLPGGKNYIYEGGFELIGGYNVSSEPFLVKSYTNYTLTVPRFYADEPWSEIEIEYYDNASMIQTISFDVDDMVYSVDSVDEWYSYTFLTSSSCNYLSISFENINGYFDGYGMNHFQLEEGMVFTSYEQYIEGTIIDTSAPYFQNAGTVVSYYDSPITVTEIQSALTAYDSIDGDVSSDIVLVSDGYTANNTILGVYDVVFEVSDTAGNTTQITIEVELVDILQPVFSTVGTLTAVFPNTYTVNYIKSLLSASDNYDGDVTDDIFLVSDEYTPNSSIVGTYEVTFSVRDSSGNTAEYIQEIVVVDEEGPIINGVETIVIGYDSPITIAEIMADISYIDNYDLTEDLELVLESDNYSSNPSVLGSYEVEFSVTDSSGNKNYHRVTIDVVDELGPMVYFDSSVIQTYTDTVMSLPDFTQLLINANELSKDLDYYISVIYDSYTKNASVPGVYHLNLNFQTETGDNLEKEFEIRVVERPIDYIHQGGQETVVEEPFFSRFQEVIIGGSLSFLLVVSNVVWIVLLKRK